ncbi:hypothetical protein C8R42DRAFT_679524 [Lentinula raphanica]|nr:hypothetical protein C8R42DRAFT_679524 [Lentinula raphanica]
MVHLKSKIFTILLAANMASVLAIPVPTGSDAAVIAYANSLLPNTNPPPPETRGESSFLFIFFPLLGPGAVDICEGTRKADCLPFDNNRWP